MFDTKIVGINRPFDYQIQVLEQILFKNKKLYKLLKILSESKLKNYYVAAGCVNQTIFNYYHDNELDFGIKDYDIVYFDDDLSYEKEDQIIKYIKSLVQDIDIECDIKNEARVHLWYEAKFDNKIEPYTSVEDAISNWGTTITCLGVRLENNKLVVYAPYGLDDLFNLTICPVKKQFTKEQYLIKTKKWKEKWPLLTINDWDN